MYREQIKDWVRTRISIVEERIEALHNIKTRLDGLSFIEVEALTVSEMNFEVELKTLRDQLSA